MLKVNFNQAFKTARLIKLPDEKTYYKVKDIRNKAAGEILIKLSEEHGPMEDEWFDPFIVKHWAITLEMLEKKINEKNLTDDDEVAIEYNPETDTYEIKD